MFCFSVNDRIVGFLDAIIRVASKSKRRTTRRLGNNKRKRGKAGRKQQALLEGKQNPFGDYSSQSGEIVGMLKAMKDEMDKDLKGTHGCSFHCNYM